MSRMVKKQTKAFKLFRGLLNFNFFLNVKQFKFACILFV